MKAKLRMMPRFLLEASYINGCYMTPARMLREARIATLSLLLSIALYGMLMNTLVHKVYDSYFFPHSGPFYGGLLYLASLSVIIYAVMHYHICLIGNYKRQAREHMPSLDEVITLYDRVAPNVTVLVPSFKEERQIMMQTMLSAALSEYPAKNVVLLIDNPPQPKDAAERKLLEQARALPQELQQQFAQQASLFTQARDAYQERARTSLNLVEEAASLAGLYERAAQWFESKALHMAEGQAFDALAGDTRFFIETMLLQPATVYREQAAALRQKAPADKTEVARHYSRLAGLFNVQFSSFERKHYANLSHDANKAMNLNSYMMLMGRSWREIETPQGLQLRECDASEASFTIPAADYVNTIDADSLMTHDYIARLVYFLEQPQHARVAVAQSPCSATPGHRTLVEKVASASIDVQFHTHQGYTYWDASFWVGANAMLRVRALNAIKEVHEVDGKMIAIYIQDRTLIEDTESTIDLVHKGWKLYNYPKRMTYSASPTDFGSLLIQRRRWANGGLIILPKLIRYVFAAPKDMRLVREFFMRFNYLAMTTLSVAMLSVYTFYTFSPRLSSPLLIYATLPYLCLFARDLKICGYRYSDVLRTCALNLMLLPVIAAGVLKQMEQIFTGRKIPFGRTPKVTGRTGAPAIYYLMEVGLIAFFANRVLRELELAHWGSAFFAGANFLLLSYALVYFIGIGAMFQDVGSALLRVLSRLVPQALIQPSATLVESKQN